MNASNLCVVSHMFVVCSYCYTMEYLSYPCHIKLLYFAISYTNTLLSLPSQRLRTCEKSRKSIELCMTMSRSRNTIRELRYTPRQIDTHGICNCFHVPCLKTLSLIWYAYILHCFTTFYELNFITSKLIMVPFETEVK